MNPLRTLLLGILLAPPLGAYTLPAAGPEVKPVQASLVSESRSFVPGQALTVALHLKQDPGWHTYWRDPGDAGLATTFDWDLPAGFGTGPLQWPKPSTFKDPNGFKGYGYENEVLLKTIVMVPRDFKAPQLKLKATATWLACREVCIPGRAELKLVLPRASTAQPSKQAALFEAGRGDMGQDPEGYPQPGQGMALQASIGFMLVLAFLGGLLLNLMPCVLPVLSLKALSFVEQARESRAQGLRLGAAFGVGVLVSFWALAGAVLILRQGGQAVGWGFQFQEPGFVLFMAALMLAFSLNLFGVFEIWLPGDAMQGLSQASRRQGLAGAFGHGLVMTLLATPCTAPFLGTALGFAFAAPAFELVAIFTAVAAGLALPYVALAVVPGVHAWLPKPGPWMLRFKQAMGLLLLATLVWLLFVLAKQVGLDAVVPAVLWLLGLALALWAYGAWGGFDRKESQRWTLIVGLIVSLVLGAGWAFPKVLHPKNLPLANSSLPQGWVAWDPERVRQLQKAGKPVFVDFTADWCWTCKVNEKAVLGREAVKEALAQQQAVLMRADWTRGDVKVTEALRSFGRSGVPLYVWYAPGKPALVLPEVLTVAILLKAIKTNQ